MRASRHRPVLGHRIIAEEGRTVVKKKAEEDGELIEEDKEEKKPKKKRRHPVRHTIFCLVLGFIIGVVFCIVKPWTMDFDRKPEKVTVSDAGTTIEYQKEDQKNLVTVSTLQAIVNKASDLITTKYHYQDACSKESAKSFKKLKLPFTTSKVVFTYKGCISLGIDLSKVQYDIDNESMEITVVIPDIEVLADEIDDNSFEIVDEKNSLFNPQELDDYATLMAELKKEKEAEVLADSDLMSEAEQNTRSVLQEFLTTDDETADYTFIFK